MPIVRHVVGSTPGLNRSEKESNRGQYCNPGKSLFQSIINTTPMQFQCRCVGCCVGYELNWIFIQNSLSKGCHTVFIATGCPTPTGSQRMHCLLYMLRMIGVWRERKNIAIRYTFMNGTTDFKASEGNLGGGISIIVYCLIWKIHNGRIYRLYAPLCIVCEDRESIGGLRIFFLYCLGRGRGS